MQLVSDRVARVLCLGSNEGSRIIVEDALMTDGR